VALAAAGMNYWCLVIGQLAGTGCTALVSMIVTPYRVRWNYDRAAMREYFDFSWPLLVASMSRLVLIQSATFVGTASLGIAAAGVITLGNSLVVFVQRADMVLTETLYPAVCAVVDRTELLFETFVKSNRLGLMWGMPFGFGAALFVPDLVEYVLNPTWGREAGAVFMLQAFGFIAALNQVAFNWDAYFRARADTKPIAVNGVLGGLAIVGIALPLLAIDGLEGFAIGMGISAAVSLAVRWFYLARLFRGFHLARHMLRAILPSIPAVLVILLLRLVEPDERTAGIAIGELAAYIVVTIGATAVLERELLREMFGYLRGRRVGQPAAA
jgi:O-antigen/teichoic acid export membrane protein